MAMPKAASHLDDFSPRGQHDVGRARQVAAMHSEPVSHAVQQSPHEQFRGRVFASHSREVAAPGGRDIIESGADKGRLGHCA
jgi:hypothetical protein